MDLYSFPLLYQKELGKLVPARNHSFRVSFAVFSYKYGGLVSAALSGHYAVLDTRR